MTCQMKKLKISVGGRSSRQVIGTRILETPAICFTSGRTDGNLLVRRLRGNTRKRADLEGIGNYDVNEKWYEYSAKEKRALEAAGDSAAPVGSPMAVEA